MSQPLVLQKRGAAWEVYLDVAAARRRAPRRAQKNLAEFPESGLIPLARTGPKTIGFGAIGDTPHRFSKGDAESLAHRIGRYTLDLGDFVHTYTEERR